MEYIIAVVDEGNITRAAKRLFITQPSLSQCIQRVETELDATLFVRTKTGIELTAAGQSFINTAEKICKEYRDLENKMVDIEELRTGRLVIGIPTLLNGYFLPEGYVYFQNRYPNVKVDLYEDDSDRLEVMLLRGKIDLAIMSLPIDSSLEIVPLVSCDMLLCAPDWYCPDDAWIDKEQNIIDIRKLAGQPFIFPRPSQKLYTVTDQILKKANLSVQKILNTRSSKGAMLYSTRGLGFTIQPEISVRFHLPLLQGRGKIYRFSPDFNEHWTIAIAHSKKGYFSTAAKCFMEEMQAFYQKQFSNPLVL